MFILTQISYEILLNWLNSGGKNCMPDKNPYGKSVWETEKAAFSFKVLAIMDIPPDIAERKYYMVDYVKIILQMKEVLII